MTKFVKEIFILQLIFTLRVGIFVTRGWIYLILCMDQVIHMNLQT